MKRNPTLRWRELPLKERLRRAARSFGHPTDGPHQICYRCDSVADTGVCPNCHRSDYVAPCAGHCVRCVEEGTAE